MKQYSNIIKIRILPDSVTLEKKQPTKIERTTLLKAGVPIGIFQYTNMLVTKKYIDTINALINITNLVFTYYPYNTSKIRL